MSAAVGDQHSRSVVVTAEHFASRMVPGAPDVFSTPSLAALVEETAAEWLAGVFEGDQTSVGSELVIRHTAPTPADRTVTVTVTVAAMEPPRYDFTWVARDDVEEVGNGTHQRFVVDRPRFLARVDRKR
ncbi:MAG: thioesterase family protein [Dehalococcoidia bacterium]